MEVAQEVARARRRLTIDVVTKGDEHRLLRRGDHLSSFRTPCSGSLTLLCEAEIVASQLIRLVQTAAEAATPQLSPPPTKGACMPKVVLTHAVEDVGRWLEGKAERAAAIGAVGSNVTDYVALDGSNKIAVTTDVDDMDAAQAMITSPPPDVAAAMQKHGVVPPITAYVEAP